MGAHPKASAQSAQQQGRAAIIDECGELDRRYQGLKPDISRREPLAKQIRAWADEEPATRLVVPSGSLCEMQCARTQWDCSI